MNRIREAISDLYKMDMEAGKTGWLQEIHPVSKLLVTVLFILLTVSWGKYDLPGLLKMGSYLVVCFVLGDISIKLLLKRMKLVLVVVCMVGIANPFFDRTPVLEPGRHRRNGFGCDAYDKGSLRGFCLIPADGNNFYG